MKHLKLFENLNLDESDEKEILEIFSEISDLGFSVKINPLKDTFLSPMDEFEPGEEKTVSYSIDISADKIKTSNFKFSAGNPYGQAPIDLGEMFRKIDLVANNIESFSEAFKIASSNLEIFGYKINSISLDLSFKTKSSIIITWEE